MVGIVSYGAYVPIYRLSREAIGQMWGKGAGKGERAIANADEDSITMGVEAVIDCLHNIDRQQVDGLYFATDSPPYIEKQAASIIRAAADLREDILTFDVAHSLRGAGYRPPTPTSRCSSATGRRPFSWATRTWRQSWRAATT